VIDDKGFKEENTSPVRIPPTVNRAISRVQVDEEESTGHKADEGRTHYARLGKLHGAHQAKGQGPTTQVEGEYLDQIRRRLARGAVDGGQRYFYDVNLGIVRRREQEEQEEQA